MIYNKSSIQKLITNFIFMVILLIFIFGRSFVGLYIFENRLGELIVAVSLLASSALFIDKNYKIFGKKIYYLQLLIWLSFLSSLFLNQGSIFEQYTYKSSSYIWGISYFYLAIFYFRYFEFTKLKIILMNTSLIYVYILSTVNYPEKLIKFFLDYSDKWDFNKAASVALFFIITTLLTNKVFHSNRLIVEYFFFISGMFLPLFIFKSRGSFIAILIFIIYQIYRQRKIVFFKDFRTLVVVLTATLITIFSTITILNQDLETIIETSELQRSFKKLANQKDTKVESFISFYIRDGKLYSIDGNFNWRIQIWQDVLFDSISDKKIIFGYGYTEIIPAMNKFERQGDDGENENVHNFLVNIFARGGLIQLILFILFYFNIMFFRKKGNLNPDVISLCIPVFIISFFDVSLENAHFPFLFYFFLSYFFKSNSEYIKIEI